MEGEGGPAFIKTHNAIANVEGFPTINFNITLAAIYLLAAVLERFPTDERVRYFANSGYRI